MSSMHSTHTHYATSAAPLPVPESRVSACFENALAVFGAHWLPLILAGAVVFSLTAAEWSFGRVRGVGWVLGIVAGLFIAGPMRWGFAGLCLNVSQGGRASKHDAIRVIGQYREIVTAGLLTFLMIVAGLALLVLPGIWVYCRTRFVPYLVVNEGLSARDAISQSFELTRGLGIPILGISAFGWLSTGVGALFFGVGALPALVWWDLALASLYHSVVLSPYEEDREAIEEELREIVA